jgi:plastocyanin
MLPDRAYQGDDMSSKVLAATALTATVVLGLTACGSSSSSGSGSSSTTKAAKPAAANPVTLSGKVTNKGTKDVSTKGTVSMELELDNFYFQPTFIKVAPGQKLTLEIKNEGSVPHTFTAPSLNIDKELQPDTKMDVTVTMPMSGNVPFYCRFHKDNGMQGAIYMTAS